jgi:hypothetical protein
MTQQTHPGADAPTARRVGERRHPGDRRRTARAMFYAHLWFGVLTTALLLIVALTGVLLNHKRGLGLMPVVEHAPTAEFSSALPLHRLGEAAAGAVRPEIAGHGVDRMDVRPADGIIKVRFDDRAVTEVTLDLVTGAVLGVGARGDAFLEQLHSGEIMGKRWVLLSDFAALGLVIALASGLWLWLYPKSRV